jgi:VanZ family protein
MTTMSTNNHASPLRWLPSIIMMAAIFAFSSLPARHIPYLGRYDFLIKKGGHALGYALLGMAYFYAIPKRVSIGFRWMLAMLMVILFALSDEFHQSFVEGRTSSLRDVVIDSCGAAVALFFGAVYSSNSRSNSIS